MKYSTNKCCREFEPITFSLTFETREELSEFLGEIGHIPLGTFPKPLYDQLKQELYETK